jgi:hypothetical protein
MQRLYWAAVVLPHPLFSDRTPSFARYQVANRTTTRQTGNASLHCVVLLAIIARPSSYWSRESPETCDDVACPQILFLTSQYSATSYGLFVEEGDAGGEAGSGTGTWMRGISFRVRANY